MMSQATLDYFSDIRTGHEEVQQVLVIVLSEINVAWTDRDWYLHPQDLVYLDKGLAAILAERRVAMELEVDNNAGP